MEELENRPSETVLFQCLDLSLLSSLFPHVSLVLLSLAFSACVYPGSAMVFLTILTLFSTWDRQHLLGLVLSFWDNLMAHLSVRCPTLRPFSCACVCVCVCVQGVWIWKTLQLGSCPYTFQSSLPGIGRDPEDVSNISTLRLLFCLLVEALEHIVPLSLIKIIIFKYSAALLPLIILDSSCLLPL